MVSSSLAHAWQFHSFIGVNPLQTTWLEHGIVSGRVALLLRSAEIQPAFGRFSDWTPNPITPPHTRSPPPTHPHTQCRPAARGRAGLWSICFGLFCAAALEHPRRARVTQQARAPKQAPACSGSRVPAGTAVPGTGRCVTAGVRLGSRTRRAARPPGATGPRERAYVGTTQADDASSPRRICPALASEGRMPCHQLLGCRAGWTRRPHHHPRMEVSERCGGPVPPTVYECRERPSAGRAFAHAGWGICGVMLCTNEQARGCSGGLSPRRLSAGRPDPAGHLCIGQCWPLSDDVPTTDTTPR